MKNFRGLFFFFLALFSLILFSTVTIYSPIFAIEYGGIGGKPANPDPSNPRTKSIFIFTLSGGESDEDEVLIINNTKERKTLLVYATDSQKSTDGSFACEQFSDEKQGVGAWIKLEKSEVTLEPSTNIKVPFTIEIPDNVDVGELNGCILIQEKKDAPSQDASGLSLSFRTGLRVVVTVPGEQVRDLIIKNFSAQFDGNLIKTKMDVENTGNVSIDSNIKINIRSVFGAQVEEISNEFPILRGETSVYNIEIQRPFWGGFFTLTPSVEFDNSQEAQVGIRNEESLKEISFQPVTIFIMPDTTALIVEIVIFLTIFGTMFILFKRLSKRREFKKVWTKVYMVEEGEDLESVAQRFAVSWKDLAKVNKLKPPYNIKKGSVLNVPEK